MVITWYGQACFKIASGDLTVAIDPYGKGIGLTPPRFGADILAITHEHFDHSNRETVGGRQLKSNNPGLIETVEPFIIDGPGEYEVKNIYVVGIHTFHDTQQGRERGLNTAYKIEMEGIRLLHMGDFGEAALREEVLDKIGEVDILLIPVGGKFTVDGRTAARLVKEIEPKIAIPMHYKIPGLKIGLAGAEEFLKETGFSKAPVEDKLTVRKKDFSEDKETQIIILKPAASNA